MCENDQGWSQVCRRVERIKQKEYTPLFLLQTRLSGLWLTLLVVHRRLSIMSSIKLSPIYAHKKNFCRRNPPLNLLAFFSTTSSSSSTSFFSSSSHSREENDFIQKTVGPVGDHSSDQRLLTHCPHKTRIYLPSINLCVCV